MINNHNDLTGKNLDMLANFLTSQLVDSTLAEQIPDEAHLFHGKYNDAALTHTNIKLATKIFLGMALGYVETAPLAMVFESQTGKRVIIDLSEDLQINEAQTFIDRFQRKVNKMLPTGSMPYAPPEKR